MTIQTTLERSCARSRCLARSLHARIFVSAAGRIYLASGKPNFAKLRQRLTLTRRIPTLSEAPTPDQLGLGCDGELTSETLHAMQRALKQWAAGLTAASSGHGRLARGERTQVDRELGELQRLQERLATCLLWSARIREGKATVGAPYLLDESSERELKETVDKYFDHASPLLITLWQTRLVYWISGSSAVSRFLQAVQPLLAADEWDVQLESVAAQLVTWKKRCASEPHRFIRRELTKTLAALPTELVVDGNLTSRLKQRSVAEHCDLLNARAVAQLRTLQERRTIDLPAAAAAVVCSDGAAAPLPGGLLPRLPTRARIHEFEGKTVWLMKESKHPGYDRLLHTLGQLKEPPAEHLYRPLRRVLLKGASLDDVIWTIQRGVLPEMAANSFRPATVRHVVTRLEHLGMIGSRRDLDPLLSRQLLTKELRWVDRWITWLSQVERRRVSPATIRRLRSAFLHTFLPAVKHVWNHEPLQSWLAAIQEPASTAAPTLHSSRLSTVLRQLNAYQRLAGDEPSVPKSIQKYWCSKETQQRERDYLGRIVHDSRAALRKRFERLTSKAGREDAPSKRRLLRTAAESCIGAACTALERQVREAGLRAWEQTTGLAFPQSELPRLTKYFEWFGAMDAGQRRLLAHILKNWMQHGDEFKRYLPANGPWLKRAMRCNLNLQDWMEPYVLFGEIGDVPVRVQAVVNPWRVFPMGTLFGTCLSFGSCNQMSLLANAHDANKQVVFLTTTDERGEPKVLGRQLIAVSNNFELLGYHCYIGLDNKLEDQRTECLKLMSTYCGQLAARCGISLADKGEPHRIGKHFWYDDGAWTWHGAARTAWERTRNEFQTELPPTRRRISKSRTPCWSRPAQRTISVRQSDACRK